VGRELDLVEDQDVAAVDDHAALVGATVFVLEAVVSFGIVRALVVDVEDAVAIVIGLGAAVFIFEAVLVFGIHRALIVDVEDAVFVVIRVGATVLVLEAVEVLGSEERRVGRVRDTGTVPVPVDVVGGDVYLLVA